MQWDEQTMEHLKEHLPDFPAKGSDILEACESMSDVPDDDKKMIEDAIDPEKSYNSLGEVMEEINK